MRKTVTAIIATHTKCRPREGFDDKAFFANNVLIPHPHYLPLSS
jgi:hypothetical protein